MSHLTPVVRPDINGKMVTRHVRASKASKTSSLATVPPVGQRGVVAASGSSLEVAKGRRWLLQAVDSKIPPFERPHLNHSIEALRHKASLVPDEVAEANCLVGEGLYDVVDQTSFAQMLVKCLDCNASPVDMESAIYYFETSDSNLRDKINEYFEFGAKKIADYPLGNFLSAVKSYDLEGFNFDPDVPMGKQEARTLEQCNALKALHYAAGEADQWEPERVIAFAEDGTLLDSALAQLVVNRPELAEDIIKVIDERHTLDSELISSIFSNPASAISEGTL